MVKYEGKGTLPLNVKVQVYRTVGTQSDIILSTNREAEEVQVSVRNELTLRLPVENH